MPTALPFDKLYPLDVDRALKKLEPIKKAAVWWTTNSQSQQLMVDGECSLGILNNGRIYDVAQKGAKIGIEWDQNLQSVDYLVVPRGSKVKDAAMALIAEMTLPESQARVSNIMPLAPTNPEAFKLIKTEMAPWLSTEPANASQGFADQRGVLARQLQGAGRALGGLEAGVMRNGVARHARADLRSAKATDARGPGDARGWLVAPAVLILGVLFVYPVAALLLRASPRPSSDCRISRS